MFTGIVEELGIVQSLNISGSSGSIAIKADKVLQGTKVGDSIAVNGVCLTVTKISGNIFNADIMAETARRSSLADVGTGDKVNLERAMAADGRFGGHIVSGHIDGRGRIVEYRKEENAIWVKIAADREILNYIVIKGSICIDGISLTVADLTDETFSVSLIPHTAKETTLAIKGVGGIVNLENDIVGKYVGRLLGLEDAHINAVGNSQSTLTYAMLENFENGV